MMQIPSIDPVLPNFPMLFDGEAMREMLRRHASQPDGPEIVSVRPAYVRYKPETSCLIAYEIDVRADGGETTYHAHIRTFADDRGRRRMTNRKLQKMVEQAEEECGTVGFPWVTYLPELNGMLSFFPIDYDLRSLIHMATEGTAEKHLRKILQLSDVELVSKPELIRYKPGRKALFRYQTGEATIYGKMHADDRSTLLRTATNALIESGLETPEVLGTNAKFGFVAHAEASGTQLASLRTDPRYGSLLSALAEPLTILHRSEVEGLPAHHLGHEVDRLRETARLLGVILPDQDARLQRIICILDDRLARIDDEMATNHGDFYDDQAIVDGDQISIIDLDEIRLAHPMLDIGNMLAHLRTGEQSGSVDAAAREHFIEGMRAHRDMTDRDIATFEAIGILKLAPGPFRRLEANWANRIEDMIGLVEETLGMEPRPAGHAHVTEPAINSDGTDDKLPELPALQDVPRMQARLREVTGDPMLDVTGIHLQRHKRGRRAILRYDIANGKPIWGKLFASKRGPRVHGITRMICEARAFGPDVALPDPIGFLPDLRVLLQRSVPGTSIGSRLFAGDTDIAETIADAISSLHVSGIALGREHDLEKELSPLHPRVEEIGGLFPHLHDAATALHAYILDLAGSVQAWRFMPVHRDFYDAQVLIDGERLSVLDLDDAAMSEPAVDIANFAAHLDLMALQHPEHAGDIGLVRDRFMARSRQLDAGLAEGLLTFLTASTLLRLAGIHAPRHDGERIAAGLIAQASASLGALPERR